jgi:small subunit ribosomal protein S1
MNITENFTNEETNAATPIEVTAENTNELTSVPEPQPETVTTNETVQAEIKEKSGVSTSRNEPKQQSPEEIEKAEKTFAEIKSLKESNSSIEVKVIGRIRGGLRVVYNGFPMFLPASHFSLKRNPSEDELQEAVGNVFKVYIHEIQEEENGKRAVIVSRKDILTSNFWEHIVVGEKIEGKVSSVASFGVFVDLGGVEGLIHISRLSQIHINNPAELFKKGDAIEAMVVDIDREKNKIALSRKELEDSPWKNLEQEISSGSIVTGIVRRLTDFGAYIELKPGVDGLLRTNEISWTKRVKKPADVLTAGQEINVAVMSVSEEKQTVSLSLRRIEENPWPSLIEKYPIGKEIEAVIAQVVNQGAVLSINDEVDGFMPRSKMRDVMKGKKIPYNVGDKVNVKISDIIPDDETVILEPVVDEAILAQRKAARENRDNRDNRESREPRSNRANVNPMQQASQPSVSLLDMLSEKEKDKLINSMD